MLEKSLFLSPHVFRHVAALTISTTLLACVIDDGPPRRLDNGYSGPPPADTSTTGGTAAPANAPPLLVLVDTGQVMNADPGQGVGVFTEYAAGGKWHIWWTCDTAKSQQSCDVSIAATIASGTIGALNSDELHGSGSVTMPTPSRVEATVTTTDQVHGISFTSTPGTVITLEATIGGLKEGPGPNRSFFFFVQDGKINGGYGGALTNPLQLQGKKP